jgi:hypothetical protein
MNNFDFIKQEKDQLIATTDLQIVLDKDLFDSEIANIKDNTIHTIGFFQFKVNNATYQVNLPVEVVLNFSEIETDKDNLYIHYSKNDIIIDSTTYIKSASNVNKFINYLISGKIQVKNPEDFIFLFTNSAKMNNVRFSAQMSSIEAMAAELTRYSKDETKTLRIALRDKNVNKNDFVISSIKNIPRSTSVFNALSFEDINKSLQSAVLMSRKNKDQNISPIEKIIYY